MARPKKESPLEIERNLLLSRAKEIRDLPIIFLALIADKAERSRLTEGELAVWETEVCSFLQNLGAIEAEMSEFLAFQDAVRIYVERAVASFKEKKGDAAPKADKSETPQGKIAVSVSLGRKDDDGPGSSGEPVIEQTQLPPRSLAPNYSKVSLTLGITKSLGNYEFARVDVGCEDFCEPDKKVETWDKLKDAAGLFLTTVLADLDKYRKGGAGQSSAALQQVSQEPVRKAAGNATEETRKRLNKELVLLAHQKFIDYKSAVEKLREIELTEEKAVDLITQLRVNNVSFFTGADHAETDQKVVDELEDDYAGTSEQSASNVG